MTGTVRWYDDKKGFGFITVDPPETGEVFVDRRGLANGPLQAGDCVEFETAPQKAGGPRAVDVIVRRPAQCQSTQ